MRDGRRTRASKMGYFSNGTEGALYELRYCDNCQHQDPDGQGCAIWLVHLLHSYPECGKKSAGEEIIAFCHTSAHFSVSAKYVFRCLPSVIASFSFW